MALAWAMQCADKLSGDTVCLCGVFFCLGGVCASCHSEHTRTHTQHAHAHMSLLGVGTEVERSACKGQVWGDPEL